ncbi:Calx-beta domain-containing protein [Singulisphaera acidiphila]|uniref:Conserved repeat protein n=1 Tax=Singulisphaera acidiphila (strain ATCC BAA-1392 / DSM 18658 / VKM B-2454 / MOB10) TaxID=886293 RepID=L0DM75_SINAD|nr:Calx-beta domain-containing protein [Singulisphaera acidiphila]AGA29910.1 conserved repeat protein [Singulisphaera acidiphila DSM 18658]
MRTPSLELPRRSKSTRQHSVRPRLELMEGRILLTIFPVTDVLDSLSPGTLRWAIGQVNHGDGGDTIAFAIPGTGVKTIRLSSALPTLSVPVTIDGTTQPSYSGTPLIQLDGSGAGAGANGLSALAGSTTIVGLSIVHFQGDAIHLTGAGNNLILGNYLGMTPDGSTVGANGGHGIYVGSGSNQIGSAQANQGNLISGNLGYGIALDGGSANVVEGNLVGVDGSGTLKRGNNAGGILVKNALNNRIGGTSPSAGNVISGNGAHGVETFGLTDGLLIQGNAIGTDRFHTLNLGNLIDGVHLFSSNNTIGGLAPGAGNAIAFNGNPGIGIGAGVSLILNVSNNQILSNIFFSNVKLGIDLGGSGNRSQQAPTLNAASTGASSTTISGSLTGSRPDAAYRIQFFANGTPDASGFGEGETFLGTLQVNTDHAGNAVFTATLPAGVAPGALISATATDPAGNTSQFALNLSTKGTADVGVAVSSSSSSVQVGGTVTFTLVVTNYGSTAARGVSATNLLPPGVTLVSVSSTDGFPVPGPNSISFYFGGLEVGQSKTATIVVQTSAASGNSITNSASVTSQEGDPNPANNIASVSVPVTALVDLAVDVQGTPGAVLVGQNVTYIVTVRNLGPSQATGVTLIDLLPENVTLVSAQATRGTTSILGNRLTTLIPTLDPNSPPVVLTIVVSTNASTPASISHTATLSANELEASLANNFASVTTTVTPLADLQVRVQGPPQPTLVGQPLTYIVTLTNQGPSTATGISLVDVLPDGVVFVSASDNVGGTLTIRNGVVTDEFASLASGGVVVLTIVVTPTLASGASLTNRASVTSLVSDPDNTNDSASVTTTVDPAADLSVIVATSSAEVGVGRPLTYTITVTNRGPSPAPGVILIDLLPANVTVTSITVSQGETTQSSGQVIGNIGTLAADAFATMTIVIQTSAANTPAITNTATASSGLADPTPDDNSVTITTNVTPRTDLAVSITPPTGPLLVNRQVSYAVTVANHGPSPATDVSLTELLPTGVAFVSAIDSLGNVLTPVNGRLVDKIGHLAADSSVTLTIVVMTIVPGNFDISATATGAEPDDDLSNNMATFTTAVVPAADLAVRLVASRGQVTTGDRLTYTLTVTNQGPSPATGVVLNETLPLGQSIVSATASQGSVSPGGGLVTARLGDLAVGASATVTIIVIPTVAGAGTARATVSSLEIDPNTADNLAIVNVQVVEPPGAFQFASPTVVVPETAGYATIVVQRTDGRQGRVAVNYYTVLSGTATPGLDFIPVSGTLVFEQGETTKTFTVPVLANPYTNGDGTVTLVLRDPQGGAVLGALSSTTLVIHDIDPDFTGPSIEEIRLFGPATSIQYITLHFSELLNTTTALSSANYQLFDVGPDGRFGTSDDRPILLQPPGYDPAHNTVTLVPTTPLLANRFYYVQASGIRDIAGNLLVPGPGATSANQFGAYLVRGTSLQYLDSHQTVVSVGVAGGGLLDLTRYANGDGDRLQLLNPTPRRTVLTGRVRGGQNTSSFSSITGLGAFGQVRVMMNSPAILVGNMPFNRRFFSPPAVDGVFNPVAPPGKPTVQRLRRGRR